MAPVPRKAAVAPKTAVKKPKSVSHEKLLSTVLDEKPTIINDDAVFYKNPLEEYTECDLASWLSVAAESAAFDTGLMPPNVLSIRMLGDRQQFVLQRPPGLNRIIWGSYEGSTSATYYSLAQPWQIIIGEYERNHFVGARLFYSPMAISHPDQPLYHANVPNLNCFGYSYQVAVGWLCLYKRQDTTKMTIAQKIAYLFDKTSGMEAFNDGNMSNTDGPRFYHSFYTAAGRDLTKYAFLWHPATWQKKSQDEGFAWTLDPDLWIPVLVNDAGQTKHMPKGKPLTLRMAMNGAVKYYYEDAKKSSLYKLAHPDEIVDTMATSDWARLASSFVSWRNASVHPAAAMTFEPSNLEMARLLQHMNMPA